MFLELDASAAKTGRPVTPVNPKTPAETPRRARDVSFQLLSYLNVKEPDTKAIYIAGFSLSVGRVGVEIKVEVGVGLGLGVHVSGWYWRVVSRESNR